MKKLPSIVIALIIILYIPALAAAPDTVSGRVGQNTYDIFPEGHARCGSHWYLLIPDREPWGYANRFALDHGGILCCIGDYYERNFINIYNSDNMGLWLGAVYDGSEWSWLSGEKWTVYDWQPGKLAAGEDRLNAALIDGRLQPLAYNDTLSVSGYLVEFDNEETCLAALTDYKSGSFSGLSSPQIITPVRENTVPAGSVSEHYRAEDSFPFVFAAAAAVFVFAAFILAIELAVKKHR